MSRRVMMKLSVSVSCHSPSKRTSSKIEINIIHPIKYIFFFLSAISIYLVTATAHVVVFRQVAPGNTVDFSGLLLLYCL